MPIRRNTAGRLHLELGDGISPQAVLDTLVSAFDAHPGTRSADPRNGWQELRIGGCRFTLTWDRWKGSGVVSEEAAGAETLRRIATWFQEDREDTA
jgi:hypothetical protein